MSDVSLIVADFKKMDARKQTSVLIGTDYAAYWRALAEHYLGPLDLMESFMDEWDAEKRTMFIYDRNTFRKFYPGLQSRIYDLDLVARLMRG